MNTERNEPAEEPSHSSRRRILKAGAMGAAGIGVGVTGTLAAEANTRSGADTKGAGSGDEERSADGSPAGVGTHTHPFYGAHQAGLDTPLAAHAVLIALTLHPDLSVEKFRGMMQILSDDAARLTQGQVPLADTEPELVPLPASLTVTFGVGERAVALAGKTAPTWLRPLPAFTIDKLEERYTGGDVLIMLMGDDPLSLSHAQRMLVKDSHSFASIKWIQKGFRNAAGVMKQGTTQRNPFGQIDGTVNPAKSDYDSLVWVNDGWLRGGCSMVVRRIAMNLDTWDELDTEGKEFSIGRTLADGAPLSGGKGEYGKPDFSAKDSHGFPVIDNYAHMRRARLDESGKRNEREQIVRRPFNYDDEPADGALSNTGQIFISLQQDVDEQFLPIQQRLADGDLLNTWTTPVGSAVFAILPGCEKGGFVGETLFA